MATSEERVERAKQEIMLNFWLLGIGAFVIIVMEFTTRLYGDSQGMGFAFWLIVMCLLIFWLALLTLHKRKVHREKVRQSSTDSP